MTVWIYTIGEDEFQEAAVVENGEVLSGDGNLVEGAFPDGIPDDEAKVARGFTGPATIASTDFDFDWHEPPEWAQGVGDAEKSELTCKTEWKPYVGDQGGTGWTDGEDVLYDDDPPGEIDQDAVDEFLDSLPEEDRQDAREALGIGGGEDPLADFDRDQANEIRDMINDTPSEELVDFFDDVAENTSDEQLKSVREELAQSPDWVMEGPKQAFSAMMKAREIESEHANTEDVIDISEIGGGDISDSIRDGVNTVFDSVDDESKIGVMFGTLDRAMVSSLDSGNAGEYQSSTNILKKVDDEAVTPENTFLHEMGHHIHHNVLGVEWDTSDDQYQDFDRSVSVDDQDFGDVDVADGFDDSVVDDLEKNWDRYTDGEVEELRSYQKKMGNEYASVSFRYWCDDKQSTRGKDPFISMFWDKQFTDAEPMESDDLADLSKGDEVVLSSLDAFDIDFDDAPALGFQEAELQTDGLSEEAERLVEEERDKLDKIVESEYAAYIPHREGVAFNRFDEQLQRLDPVSFDVDIEVLKEIIDPTFTLDDMGKENISMKVESGSDGDIDSVSLTGDRQEISGMGIENMDMLEQAFESGVSIDE